MRQDCLEIGTIQAFIDGELGSKDVTRVSAHVAVCDSCAFMLGEAEDESAVVFPALEREFNSLVPTQRLWNKINDSLTEERQSRPFWQKLWGTLSAGLLTPSMAAAASLIIVVGVVALALINRGLTPTQTASTRPVVTSVSPSSSASTDRVISPTTPESTIDPVAPPARIERADYRPVVHRSPATVSDVPAAAKDTSSAYMPGEESYVRTIASLSRTIADQKDNTIRGSERMSFERDLAVVDDAITKMRAEVRKNPRNESAKQVLYSSYQNKIDLLNSVSQKEELVASLK